MNKIFIVLSLVSFQFTLVMLTESINDFDASKQDWGYVNVREGANLFWWLYHTTGTTNNWTDRPLVVWLDGGPGGSGTGLANFDGFGPLDLYLKPRNTTWVQEVNVLYIDSPVGVGFSYVDDDKYLTSSNNQTVDDLLQVFMDIFNKLPELRTTDLHIFGYSYGGKTAVQLAYALSQKINEKQINCNLKSVTSISGWISPIDLILSWAPYLLTLGFVDENGYNAILKSAIQTKDYSNVADFGNASIGFDITQEIIRNVTYGGISLSNMIEPKKDYRLNIEENSDDANRLQDLMRGPVSHTLGIPKHVQWASQSIDKIFEAQADEFMKPVTNYVELLLNDTSIEVNLIMGQLDIIVTTIGTMKWLNNLKWNGGNQLSMGIREPIVVDDIVEGYFKQSGKLQLFWVNRAGHSVPLDNVKAMAYILRSITTKNDKK